jgi:hypothetical protein
VADTLRVAADSLLAADTRLAGAGSLLVAAADSLPAEAGDRPAGADNLPVLRAGRPDSGPGTAAELPSCTPRRSADCRGSCSSAAPIRSSPPVVARTPAEALRTTGCREARTAAAHRCSCLS